MIYAKFEFDIVNSKEYVYIVNSEYWTKLQDGNQPPSWIVVVTVKSLFELIHNVNREVRVKFQIDISWNKEDMWLLL